MKVETNLRENSVANYHREISILKKRIANNPLHEDHLEFGKPLSEWLDEYINELEYAKYLKSLGKFN